MKKIISVMFATTMLFACCKKEKLNGNNYINKSNDNVQISLSFAEDEDRLFGKVVNNYFTTYKIEDKALNFGGIASTMMMGPQNAMEVEQKYFGFLNNNPVEYEIKGNQLILKNKNGDTMIFDKVEEIPETEN
ncbi:META domain-containing protein [bacterium]|nr:META domain-containing protein [bacterium]